MKKWLTDELDKIPYKYNEEEIKQASAQLNVTVDTIKDYYLKNPEFKELEEGEKAHESRFFKSALSFLTLENSKELGIVDRTELSDNELHEENEIATRLISYKETCKMAHDMAKSEYSYLDDRMFVRLHSMLYANDKDAKLYKRPRLRNENDGAIIVGNACFNPVEGENVTQSFLFLLF